MEDQNAKPKTEEKQINQIHPSGFNRAQRRLFEKNERRELQDLQSVRATEFQPLDVSGLEYDEGVVKPTLDPTWPWVLEEVTQRHSDNKIVGHKMTGMSTRAVSQIRIHYAKPNDHLTFRRGKPIALEFKDATTTLKLTRQSQLEKAPVVVTNAEDAIKALESEK